MWLGLQREIKKAKWKGKIVEHLSDLPFSSLCLQTQEARAQGKSNHI